MIDPLLTSLHRRRTATRVIAAVAPWLGVGLAATLVVAVVVRLLVPGGHPVWQAVLGAAALAPIWPLIRSWRDRDPRWVLAGHLDQLSGGGGLAMALAGTTASGSNPWSPHLAVPLAAVRLPTPDLRPLLLPALLSVALAAVPLLPAAQPPPPAKPSAIRSLVEPLAGKVETLAATLPLPEAERLRAAIDQLRSATTGLDAAGWEAFDRLSLAVESQTSAQAARLAQALAAAAQSQALIGANPARIEAAAGDLVQALAAVAVHMPLPELPQDLAQVLAQAAAAHGGAVPPELAKLMAGAKGMTGAPSAAEVAALGDWVEKSLQAYRAKLGLDPTLPRNGRNGRNGSGTPERGPGHPDLQIDPRDPLPVGDAAGLPPGVRLNADGSLTIGESIRDPGSDERVAAAQQAAVTAIDPAAADARRVRVAPRHQAAVGAYFQDPVPATKP